MNPQLKTILLTVLTLSALTIAVIELSGISSTALWNKYELNVGGSHTNHSHNEMQEATDSGTPIAGLPKTQISFAQDHFDFGSIKEGEKVRHTFIFTNTGQHPLLISDAIASCGCTVPTFSKAPIAPGEKGEITVEFDSSNRKGQQRKNVIVVSNSEQERVSIGFSVEVL